MRARHANCGDQDPLLVPDNLDGTEGALFETVIPHERGRYGWTIKCQADIWLL